MDLIGKKVRHSKFGEGIITQLDASHLSVKFFTETKNKSFQYPTCFKCFLQLIDTDMEAQADAVINQYEEEEKKKKQKIAEEAEKYRFKEPENKGSDLRKATGVYHFNSVADFCNEYKWDINNEIIYLKEFGGKRHRIIDGKRIENRNNRYVYTFESDDELTYPEGTQISVWKGGKSIPGYIVGCEEFTVIIEIGVNLGEDVPQLEFSAEPWRLLNSLSERLDNISVNTSKLVKSLICDGKKFIDAGNHEITTGQQTAVQMSKSQPITFVWGPPGTGKTQTLAKISLEHLELGHRVLVLSYSNVSVDGAIMRVNSMKSNIKQGEIVRYGYVRNKELLENDYLVSYNLAISKHPNLLKERQELVAERKKVLRTSQRYVDIDRRLTLIKNILSSEEKEIVKNARFVATTVSKAIVDSEVRDKEFDVVIFDEASMAYVPQIVFAASLAKKHFVCMGDFRQLPPIVQSGGKSLLNTDIFQYTGITFAIEHGINHKWLCMLNVQHRMHSDIAEFANQFMYGGLLYSEKDIDQKRHDIVEQKPISGAAIAFADLSGMMSVCMKTRDNSRVNILSALISFSMALESAVNNDVGVITPYHAQSRLLYSMARDTATANPELKPISCATVHQFQGSEKDIIVYDTVDCYRMSYPGILLTSLENDYANRLYNVAVTRAKGKFIGVANVEYMDNKKLSKNLMLEHMIKKQRNKQSFLTGERLIDKQNASNSDTMKFFDKDEGNRCFLKDISEAQNEIRIDIPDKPVEDEFLQKLTMALQTSRKAGVKVCIRTENKQGIPAVLRTLAVENKYAVNPVVLIDKEIVWFGMPSSDADFKAEGKVIPTRHRPVIRFKGKHTVTAIYGFLGMNNTIDQSETVIRDDAGRAVTDTLASYVLAYKRCPSCGKPMRLKKSRKGSFFLACTGYPKCSEMTFIDRGMVERYFYCNGKNGKLCIQCNCLLEVKDGIYGLYIQCTGVQRHKYKLDEI